MILVEIHNKESDGQYRTVDSKQLTQGDSPRQLSLADGAALLAARKLPGLCTKRFNAELITGGIDYKALSPGSRLLIGSAVLEITAVGKRCFDECAIHQAGEICPIPSHCAFARVIYGGHICTGMDFYQSEQTNPERLDV